MSDEKPPRNTSGQLKNGVSRSPGRPFQPGQSGNPKGFNGQMRGRLYDVSQLAQQYTPEAVKGLVAIARNKRAPAMARVVAWIHVLDRGHGKPTQSMDLSAKDGSLAEMFRNAVRSANGLSAEAPEQTGRSGATH